MANHNDKDLLLAILSMDSYNRGDDPGIAGLGGAGTMVGNATVGSDELLPAGSEAAGFYAVSYTLTSGETVISYRGTDGNGDLDDWALGGGNWQVEQAALAAEFYQAVNGDAITPNSNITLVGHSLGGGLAGFVGAIYGVEAVIFDNMAFELSAENLYEVAGDPAHDLYNLAQDNFFQGGTPPATAPDISQLSGYAVTGEFLDGNRSGQNTPVEPIDSNGGTS